MSALAVAGVIGQIAVALVLVGGGGIWSDPSLILTTNLILNLAILGFAVCLGALLSGYRFKALAIMGMVVCLLLIVGWFVILLLPSEPSGVLT